jgi:hypothetical protein
MFDTSKVKVLFTLADKFAVDAFKAHPLRHA